MSTQNPELQRRLAQGLAKIALAIRHGQQAAAGPRRLSPTQAQILAVVAADGGRGLGLGWVADWLGVTAATASQAVSTLEDKGLLAKHRAADDRRNIRLLLTPEGEQEVRRTGLVPEVLLQALDALAPDEQATLLRLVVKLIRELQLRGQVSVARMCVSCQHFRPNVHADAEAPHHCAFVDTAFGDHQQMIDCPDHEALSPQAQAEVWDCYTGRLAARRPSTSDGEAS